MVFCISDAYNRGVVSFTASSTDFLQPFSRIWGAIQTRQGARLTKTQHSNVSAPESGGIRSTQGFIPEYLAERCQRNQRQDLSGADCHGSHQADKEIGFGSRRDLGMNCEPLLERPSNI